MTPTNFAIFDRCNNGMVIMYENTHGFSNSHLNT